VGVIERVERWFFDPQPLLPLVLARIIFGLTLFLAYLMRWPDVQMLYGPRGLPGPALIQDLDPLPTPFQPIIALVNGSGAHLPPSAIWIAYAALLVAALCFALGWRTRAAGVATLLLHLVFVRVRNPLADWGWAEMIQPFLAYVIAAPSGRHLSIDARLAGRPRGDPAAWTAPAWPLRLLQIHVCVMYGVSSWGRIDDPGWLQGQAVFVAVVNVLFSKWVTNWHPAQPALAAMTYATIVIECTAPLALWVPRLRTWWAYALITLHLGLEALTHVGWWNFVMIGGLLSFLPPPHLAHLLARADAGRPRLPSPADRGARRDRRA
jgi:hypothetical protein